MGYMCLIDLFTAQSQEHGDQWAKTLPYGAHTLVHGSRQ